MYAINAVKVKGFKVCLTYLLNFDVSTVDGEETLPELELVCERVGIGERDQRHFYSGRAEHQHLLSVGTRVQQ